MHNNIMTIAPETQYPPLTISATDDLIVQDGDTLEDLAEILELTDLESALGLVNTAQARTIGELNEDLEDAKHDLTVANSRLEDRTNSANFWRNACAAEIEDKEHYRELLIQIGRTLGPAVYTTDDGVLTDEVIVEKVPSALYQLRNVTLSRFSDAVARVPYGFRLELSLLLGELQQRLYAGH